MKKKHFILVLSSLLIASFAFGCAPKAPEDRFIEVVETLFAKLDTTKNCDVVAKDIESYCESVCVELAVSRNWRKDASNPEDAARGRKVDKAMDKLKDKYKHINNNACARDAGVSRALSLCSRETSYF